MAKDTAVMTDGLTLRELRVSRRSALRGLGAGAALFGGMLRSMRAAEAQTNNTRAAFFFHANGSHYAWTPKGEGEAFQLTPHLMPLEPLRKDILILKNMQLARGMGNAHKAATLSALGAGSPLSIDQTVANHVKATTPLASLELAIGFTAGGGGKAPSLSQVGGSFLPGERNPVAAYQRVAARVVAGPTPMTMGNGDAERALMAKKSVLDYLRGDAERFRTRLGGAEKPKMEHYLESLREVERGLGGFMGGVQAAASCGKPGSSSAPEMGLDYELKMVDLSKGGRLLLDIMALALSCGVTRVASIMWGGGECQEDIDYTAIKDWHITTHGNPNGAPGDKIMKMQAVLAGEYAYFINKLKSYGDGAGSPFDSTFALWGTQNGNTNQTNFSKEDHDRHNTPFVLTGRGGIGMKLGRIMDCGDVSHPDLYVAVARAMGMNITSFGDPAWNKAPLPGLI